jgi:hypothetical protein
VLSGYRWTNGGVVLRKIASMIREWSLLTKEEADQLLAWARELERRSGLPPQLTREADQNPGRSSGTGDFDNEVNVLDADNVCSRTR